MGNLVTTRINFERRDGETGFDAFSDVIARLTRMSLPEIREGFARAAHPAGRVYAPFDMEILRPVPDVVSEAETRNKAAKLMLGLALLSTPDRDLVSAYWESRDPLANDMPPHMVMTAHSVLEKHGLADVDPMTRRHLAMMRHGDALDAGRAARQAFEETGKFDGTTWRRDAWGTRDHAEDVFLWFERGLLCAKFDTVNAGPDEWLKELAKALPKFHFSGVSYDADTDYSLHFVTDEPGVITIDESDDPDDVTVARAFVAGMTVEDLEAEDRLLHGGDEEPDDDMEP